MTYREKLAEIHPEYIDPIYGAGVRGCPDRYFKDAFSKKCALDTFRCEQCWDREYQGEEIL